MRQVTKRYLQVNLAILCKKIDSVLNSLSVKNHTRLGYKYIYEIKVSSSTLSAKSIASRGGDGKPQHTVQILIS